MDLDGQGKLDSRKAHKKLQSQQVREATEQTLFVCMYVYVCVCDCVTCVRERDCAHIAHMSLYMLVCVYLEHS